MMRKFITVPALLAGVALTLGACGGGGGGGGGSAVDNTTNAVVDTGNNVQAEAVDNVTDTQPSKGQDPEGIVEEPTPVESSNTTAKTGIIPAITKDMWNHMSCTIQRSFGGGPVMENLIPVHINNDNHIDFVSQLTCADQFGKLTNEAVDETVVAYLSNDKGEYRVATEEVFGSSIVQVNGLGYYSTTDINRDGKKDIIWNLNKEDGRSAMGEEGLHNNGANPVVLMSTPTGFEIQKLPIYGWFHGHTVADYPTHTDVWFASLSAGHYQMRYQNGMWAQVNSWNEGKFSGGEMYVDYKNGVIDPKWATAMVHVKTKSGKEIIVSQVSYWDFDTGLEGAKGLGSTNLDGELISHDMVEAGVNISLYGWNENFKCVGQQATQGVIEDDGEQFGYANYDNVCHVRDLVPGGPDYIAALMVGFKITSGTPWVDGQSVVENGPGIKTGAKINFFEIHDDGSLSRVPSPFVYEDTDIPNAGLWMRCDDMNGDGYADLGLGVRSNQPDVQDSGRAGAPLLYMNDGTGKLNLVPLADLPKGGYGAWSNSQYNDSVIVDADSDGDEDIIIYGATQPYDGVIHYTK